MHKGWDIAHAAYNRFVRTNVRTIGNMSEDLQRQLEASGMSQADALAEAQRVAGQTIRGFQQYLISASGNTIPLNKNDRKFTAANGGQTLTKPQVIQIYVNAQPAASAAIIQSWNQALATAQSQPFTIVSPSGSSTETFPAIPQLPAILSTPAVPQSPTIVSTPASPTSPGIFSTPGIPQLPPIFWTPANLQPPTSVATIPGNSPAPGSTTSPETGTTSGPGSSQTPGGSADPTAAPPPPTQPDQTPPASSPVTSQPPDQTPTSSGTPPTDASGNPPPDVNASPTYSPAWPGSSYDSSAGTIALGALAAAGLVITAAYVIPVAGGPTATAGVAALATTAAAALAAGLFGPGSSNSAEAAQPGDAGGGDIPQVSDGETNGERDPLVIDLAGTGLNMLARSFATPYFDFTGSGTAQHTAWIGIGTGFLGVVGPDGLIDNGSDLIDTFAQLRAMGANGAGVIDASAPEFSKLVVWEDINGDGVCQANEVFTLAQLGIVSISVDSSTANTVINGSTVEATATATMADGTTRQIAQVALNASPTYTTYLGPIQVSVAAALLPQLQGYGTLMDLQHAMSADLQLLADVQNLVAVDTFNTNGFDAAVQMLLYRWAGVDDIAPDSRGAVFDGQKLGFIEALTGVPYVDAHGMANPENTYIQAPGLDQSWNDAVSGMKARLLVQDPASVLSTDFTWLQGLDYIIPNSGYISLIDDFGAQAPSDAADSLSFWSNALTVLSESISDLRQIVLADTSSVLSALESTAPSYFSTSVLTAAANGQLTFVDASSVGAADPHGSTVYTESNDLIVVTAPNMTINVSGTGNEIIVPGTIGFASVNMIGGGAEAPEIRLLDPFAGIGSFELQDDAGYWNTSTATLVFGSGVTASQISASADDWGNLVLTDGISGNRIQIDRMMQPGNSGQPALRRCPDPVRRWHRLVGSAADQPRRHRLAHQHPPLRLPDRRHLHLQPRHRQRGDQRRCRWPQHQHRRAAVRRRHHRRADQRQHRWLGQPLRHRWHQRRPDHDRQHDAGGLERPARIRRCPGPVRRRHRLVGSAADQPRRHRLAHQHPPLRLPDRRHLHLQPRHRQRGDQRRCRWPQHQHRRAAVRRRHHRRADQRQHRWLGQPLRHRWHQRRPDHDRQHDAGGLERPARIRRCPGPVRRRHRLVGSAADQPRRHRLAHQHPPLRLPDRRHLHLQPRHRQRGDQRRCRWPQHQHRRAAVRRRHHRRADQRQHRWLGQPLRHRWHQRRPDQDRQHDAGGLERPARIRRCPGPVRRRHRLVGSAA